MPDTRSCSCLVFDYRKNGGLVLMKSCILLVIHLLKLINEVNIGVFMVWLWRTDQPVLARGVLPIAFTSVSDSLAV